MAETCSDLGNTGELTCPFLMKVITRPMLTPIYGSDGTVNKIARADLTKTLLQAQFDNVEPLDRLYPLPLVDNVTDERAEATYFEWESGGKTFIKENARDFSGMVKRLTPEWIGRINQWTGQEAGFYAWDADGNFIYQAASDGSDDIYPIPLDGGSIHAGLIKWNYSDPLMGMVQFSTLQGVVDADLRMIKAADLDFDGLSNTDVFGLKEVVVNITAATATSGTFTAKLDQEVDLSGLVLADIVAYNVTDSASITLSDLTETGTLGTYTWTNAAGVTTGDTVKITISKTKLSFGYDTFVATA